MRALMSAPTRNLSYGLAFMAGVVLFGVVGYMVAGWTFSDAAYMVVITLFSVGYGEVRPIQTEGLREFTITLIVLGYTSVIFVSGALVQFLLEGQIRRAFGDRRMNQELKRLQNHALICGYGRIGRMVAAELKAAKRPFIIIDRDTKRLAEAKESGFLTLEGDAMEESVLLQAGIERASVLATVLPSDASNVFITLSARNLHPNIIIIARGEDPATERKLLQAGANRVVLPALIGAERIAHIILFPEARELIDNAAKSRHLQDELGDLGLEMEECVLTENSPFIGQTIGQLEAAQAGAIMVVAVHRQAGGTELKPNRETILAAGDGVVAVCRGHSLTGILRG
jgi:voltage-gated potassium channel